MRSLKSISVYRTECDKICLVGFAYACHSNHPTYNNDKQPSHYIMSLMNPILLIHYFRMLLGIFCQYPHQKEHEITSASMIVPHEPNTSKKN